ncbi:hypothetical protein [Streptomyces omiyaensis]|uniref:hypothetical protein n=1 Tax=Streptomyces omiyaensis TaxID=68247 RepID=UPI001674AD59|nr:hypothetical protein [Streptomyces omiyaensis]GGY81532.1 hypothetical protein GCM10010363_72910 [Streptomyces omiyaensis]
MRSALRTAVTVAAVAGAVLAPATTVFATTPGPAPATTAPTLSAKVPVTTTPPATTPSTVTPPATTAPATPAGESLGRRPLADGGHAALYRVATGSYLAVLHDPRGKTTGELKADGSGAGDQFGTVFVILEADGTVRSWRNPHPSGGDFSEVRDGCTVTRHAAAPFKGVSMALTNSPDGPVARLSQNGKVIATLDAGHLTALYGGARIKGLRDPIPSLQMRVHSGPIPWAGLGFPAVPEDCTTATDDEETEQATPTAPAPSASPTVRPQARTGAHTPQTVVVPKGSVAAGVEPTAVDHGLVLAGGAALAGAGAAGVALALFRRRGTTD